MSGRGRVFAALALALGCAGPVAAAEGAALSTLRVCAPSDNFPISTQAKTGFENKLAELIARDLHVTLAYTWWPARENFLDRTLKKGRCDMVMGVPAGMAELETTQPYYRSSYVFIARRGERPDIVSLADPRLKQRKIGVYLIGDEQTPPAAVLANEGLNANVTGFMSFFDRSADGRSAGVISALQNRTIDIAAVWGPLAGYYVQHNPALTLHPIADTERFKPLLFRFDIAMGMRKGDTALRAALDAFIARHRPEIAALLGSYGVPLLPLSDAKPRRWAFQDN